MKIIIKRLLSILTVFIIICICLITYTNILPSTNTFGARAVGYREDENKNLDIVLLGDSCVECAVIPALLYKETGYSSYNSGEAMCKLNKMRAYAEDIYKYQQPNLFIIDTSAFMYKMGEGEDGYITYYDNPFQKLYNNHDYWKKMNLINEIKLNKGYMAKLDSVQFEDGYTYLSKNSQKSLTEEKKDYIKDFIKFINDNGSEVLFVTVPLPETGNDNLQSQINEFFLSINQKYIDFNYPDKLENYNDIVDIENETCDKVHLNINGAIKVTNYLSYYIKKNYSFNPINNNDKYISDCDKFLNKYKSYIKQGED